jgi:hypothetical protein
MADRIATLDEVLAGLAGADRASGRRVAAGAAPARLTAVARAEDDYRRRRLLLAEAQAASHTMPPARGLTDLERCRRRLAAASR